MTVLCEQFVHTSMPGRGFVTLTSPGLAGTKGLREVIPSFDPARVDSGIVVLTPDSGPIAGKLTLSYLKRELDEYKRPFVHNHTLILQRSDYSRMGGHPKVVEPWFLGPEKLRSDGQQELGAIHIDPARLPRTVPGVEDLRRVSDAFGKEGVLADLLWSIEGGHQRTVTLGGEGRDPIELIYALLRLLPPHLRTFSLSTPEASGSSRRNVLLTVVHSGRNEAAIQVSSTTGQVQGSKVIFDGLEEAIFRQSLKDLASIWRSFETRHSIAQSLEHAKGRIVAGELDVAEKELVQAAQLLKSPTAQSTDRREYQVQYLELAKRRHHLDVYWNALNDATLEGDKPATVAKVLQEEAVDKTFKSGLASASIREYGIKELKDAGVLDYVVNDRVGLADSVVGGKISLDRAVLALTAQGVRRSPFLKELFRFEITLEDIDGYSKTDFKPRFLQYLDELGRLDTREKGQGMLFRSILDLYVDRVQEALEKEFGRLASLRRQSGNDQRPRFAAGILSLMSTYRIGPQFSELAAIANAKEARKKFERLQERLSNSAGKST